MFTYDVRVQNKHINTLVGDLALNMTFVRTICPRCYATLRNSDKSA